MKDKILHFIGFVTTGPSPAEDKVLEVAVVKMRGMERLGHFAKLADPGPIPLAVKKLTGVDESRVINHPTPYEVMEEAFRLIGNEPAVVHDMGALVSFARAEDLTPPSGLIDNLALARTVLPAATDFSLGAAADELGLQRDEQHRALSNALLTQQVWLALLDRARGLPGCVLSLLQRIAESADEPLADLFGDLVEEKGEFLRPAGRDQSLGDVLPAHKDLLRQVQEYEPPEPAEEPLQTKKLCGLFAPQGLVGRNLPGYEERPEQLEMVRRVCEAFNEAQLLMMEAGTGTGKSMAYLAPAIAWACQNHDKVVISTNTKNLQHQLQDKDLPFLRDLFAERFESALLKGRRNYLCVRRFLHLTEHFERELAEPAEVRSLLPVVVWAATTNTGDLSECSGLLLSPHALSLAARMVSGGEECAGRACRFGRKCWVRRARALARLSELIVVNHSLLFAELGSDQVLPPHRCLIFDESQNIEDAATNALAVSVDSLSFFRVTNRMYRRRRDGSGSGMLTTVMYELEKGLPSGSRGQLEKVKDVYEKLVGRLDEVVDATRQFFELLLLPFAHLEPYQNRALLGECQPPVNHESEAGKAAETLKKTVQSFNSRIEELAEELGLCERYVQKARELANDLRAQAAQLQGVCEELDFVLDQARDDHVYWLERIDREHRTFVSLHAAPLVIRDHMKKFFLDPKRTVIFTSATLQVGGSFDYMLERLGADEFGTDRLQCAAVGSSFDYDAQSLICVPTFLPDPGGRRDKLYDAELASALIELLRATRGRALVLFTSYSLLDAVYDAIKWPLEKSGIAVLAQGRDGSRERITAVFRRITSSVLLGTRSFWEGVDISGETLSCLVMTKLPFQVFTDPIVQGRTEFLRSQGLDPFQHYTLPEAVIAFRQGFGRLIRSKRDRGVIVAADRRLVTKKYGRMFLASLPTRYRVFREPEPMLEAIRGFFRAPR